MNPLQKSWIRHWSHLPCERNLVHYQTQIVTLTITTVIECTVDIFPEFKCNGSLEGKFLMEPITPDTINGSDHIACVLNQDFNTLHAW